jgi:hypothetical protein
MNDRHPANDEAPKARSNESNPVESSPVLDTDAEEREAIAALPKLHDDYQREPQ